MLRKEWGFEGITLSDYFGIMLLQVGHKVAANPAEAGRQAMAAGVDLEFPWAYGYAELPNLIRSGKVSTVSLDAAVGRRQFRPHHHDSFRSVAVSLAENAFATPPNVRAGGWDSRRTPREMRGSAVTAS